MLVSLAFLVTFLVRAGDVGPPLTDLPFVVIVNRSNSVTSLRRAELSAILMRKSRSWPDRAEIVPIDRPAKSGLREAFSKSIHGKSAAYVVRYWQRLIFSGRGVPPRELSSDAAVIEFVSSNSGAIGYVDRAAVLGDEVKIVAVTK
jgi:ABC-type phosphate transport system substrate-binding protein